MTLPMLHYASIVTDGEQNSGFRILAVNESLPDMIETANKYAIETGANVALVEILEQFAPPPPRAISVFRRAGVKE
jgi:hypothetical protein